MMTYFYSPGACSLGPHIVIEELGLDVERCPVRIAEKQHLSADYLKINPRGRVPALVVDGNAVTEASAILTYLASLKPEAGLLPPAGSIELARALELVAWLASTLHIAYAQLWRPERFLPAGTDASVLTGHARTLIAQRNQEVETWIRGRWVLSETYSIADAYLLIFYRWANRTGHDMAKDCPRWTEWTKRMLERPAVARTLEIEGISLAG